MILGFLGSGLYALIQTAISRTSRLWTEITPARLGGYRLSAYSAAWVSFQDFSFEEHML